MFGGEKRKNLGECIHGWSFVLNSYRGNSWSHVVERMAYGIYPTGGAAGSVSNNKDRQSSVRSRDMGKIYQVLVHGLRGEKMIIDLCNTEEQMKTMTVQQLKEKVADKLPETAGQENLRLIFTDKMLEEDSTPLSEYGIQHMSVIQLVIKVPGGLPA